jgi:prephenate dehydratase
VETYDILRDPALGKTAFIRGEQILSVRHCLIALSGTKIEDITSVSSHEQVISRLNHASDGNPLLPIPGSRPMLRVHS